MANSFISSVSKDVGTTASTIYTATTATLGGVKIGSGISITGDGTISASSSGITTGKAIAMAMIFGG